MLIPFSLTFVFFSLRSVYLLYFLVFSTSSFIISFSLVPSPLLFDSPSHFLITKVINLLLIHIPSHCSLWSTFESLFHWALLSSSKASAHFSFYPEGGTFWSTRFASEAKRRYLTWFVFTFACFQFVSVKGNWKTEKHRTWSPTHFAFPTGNHAKT